jgi:hypothetical protein
MKVTIYKPEEFMGEVIKYEGTLIEHGIMEYAQYKEAPFVSFTPKRARSGIRFVQGRDPFFLIVDGWNNPDPVSGYLVSKKGECTIRQSKYSCFDERYRTDFNEWVKPLIESGKLKIVADYRSSI